MDSMRPIDRGLNGEAPSYVATGDPWGLMEMLQGAVDDGRAEEGRIISVLELLAFVVLAALRGRCWRGNSSSMSPTT